MISRVLVIFLSSFAKEGTVRELINLVTKLPEKSSVVNRKVPFMASEVIASGVAEISKAFFYPYSNPPIKSLLSFLIENKPPLKGELETLGQYFAKSLIGLMGRHMKEVLDNLVKADGLNSSFRSKQISSLKMPNTFML